MPDDAPIGCPPCPSCGSFCVHTTIGGKHSNPMHRCWNDHDYRVARKEAK